MFRPIPKEQLKAMRSREISKAKLKTKQADKENKEKKKSKSANVSVSRPKPVRPTKSARVSRQPSKSVKVSRPVVKRLPSRPVVKKQPSKHSIKRDRQQKYIVPLSSEVVEPVQNKYLVKLSEAGKYFKFSGTIIYCGSAAGLDPARWSPLDKNNSPSGYDWDQISQGTHVLDQTTCLTWVVREQIRVDNVGIGSVGSNGLGDLKVVRKLDLAPCQILRLNVNTPRDLTKFSTERIRPHLPALTEIPVGTQFYFKDSSQGYVLSRDDSNNSNGLVLKVNGVPLRPNQVIPIPINSLFNTEKLYGLDVPILKSNLQRLTGSGYSNMADWLGSLLPGDGRVPGHLGHLPRVEQLQENDLLEFYDPNQLNNPHIDGKNPNGSAFVKNVHESRYFKFRLRVVKNRLGMLVATPVDQALVVEENKLKVVNCGLAGVSTSLSGNLSGDLSSSGAIFVVPPDHEVDLIPCGDEMVSTLKILSSLYPKSEVELLDQQLKYTGDFRVIWLNSLRGQVVSSNGGSFSLVGQMDYYKYEVEPTVFKFKARWKSDFLRIDSVTIDGMSMSLTTAFSSQDYEKSKSEMVRFLRSVNRGLVDWGYPSVSLNWSSHTQGNQWTVELTLTGAANGILPTIGLNLNERPICVNFQAVQERKEDKPTQVDE